MTTFCSERASGENLDAEAIKPMAMGAGDALVVVDMQRDFLIDGPLAVPGGSGVLPVLNHCIRYCEGRHLPVVLTRDWHPPGHASFVGKGGHWPVHCVVGSWGAAFADALRQPEDAIVISKGYQVFSEGYSAFEETDLVRRLRAQGVRRLVVGGLALEYCVRQTVLDAIRLGFDVVLLADGVAAMTRHPEDQQEVVQQMQQAGAVVALSRQLCPVAPA